jgi:hypothetical protein
VANDLIRSKDLTMQEKSLLIFILSHPENFAINKQYLYNSLPYDFNPASLNSNLTSAVGEEGFLPMIRSIGGSVKVRF